MLKLKHLGRYTELGLLLTRYGLKDFHLQPNPEEPVPFAGDSDAALEPDVAARAEAFAQKLSDMGPTFVKFGQLLSTRPDLVPPEYIRALEKLQDNVEPFPYEDIERIVEEELKVRISKAFDSFEKKPIAAASLGQVHRATLRDGREVVVKVQRPGIQERVREDLEVFTEIANALEQASAVARRMNFVATVANARWTLTRELDYRQEARNTEIIRTALADFPEIYIPEVIEDLSTGKVLTSEMIHGTKVSKLTPISMIDHDYEGLAVVLTRAYLKQICVDGFWHSDPHPGNVFVADGKLILLDFGMASRITREFQDEIIKLLLGLSANRGTLAAESCMKMGTTEPGFDRQKFIHDVSEISTHYYDIDLKQVNMGHLMFLVIGVANANQLSLPSELAMLAKTLLHLDSITKKLDPNFDAQGAIRDYTEELIRQKVVQKFHPRNFYHALLDLNQLAVDLPGRARQIIDQTESGNLTLRLKLDQVDTLLKGMHKIANRITVGLVIAALLVSSALMARVPNHTTMFGYPAVSMVGYLIAAGCGLYLVLSILLKDRKDKESAKEG